MIPAANVPIGGTQRNWRDIVLNYVKRALSFVFATAFDVVVHPWPQVVPHKVWAADRSVTTMRPV